MQLNFGKLSFVKEEDKIYLLGADGEKYSFAQVHISGEIKGGPKLASSSEGDRLTYVSHNLQEDCLEIVQRSKLVEVTTVLCRYADADVVRAYTQVKNISEEEIVLEEVSAFMFSGFGKNDMYSVKDLYFEKFVQSHHAECQPRRISFFDYGMHVGNWGTQKRISQANIGSWSTKEALPQGIVENAQNGSFFMFQIECNHSWYYEISEISKAYYLWLGGASLSFGGWSKKLTVGESYRTVNVAIAFGKSRENVLGEMTKYRRHIAGKCVVDAYLPAIYNEYMHLSWDNPTEEQTAKIAPVIAKTGVEYYVIDCGWHNEESGWEIYPYVGQWKQSNARFPKGVRYTTDFIRSLGMKAGLWIEPEIIGVKCKDMLAYYDDDCFLQRNGKKIAVMNRYFLDFRAKKVVEYMTETIRRMVEEYGAEYIKMDYNQDCGVGTDYLSFCAGEGLEQAAEAYLQWVDSLRARFPQVLFETCSSGGMRMDYSTLSHYSIVSTSDQTNYKKYPYIAGNIVSAVLPEQAAVWSYPVDTWIEGVEFEATREWTDKNISEERVIMNMINSFLGRMHLASHLELISEEKFRLVQEGVAYYNSLTNDKLRATPFLPLGFTRFGEEIVASGLQTEEKIYLAVWNLSNEARTVEIPVENGATATLAYPRKATTEYVLENGGLTVRFENGSMARFFEIQKNKF